MIIFFWIIILACFPAALVCCLLGVMANRRHWREMREAEERRLATRRPRFLPPDPLAIFGLYEGDPDYLPPEGYQLDLLRETVRQAQEQIRKG